MTEIFEICAISRSEEFNQPPGGQGTFVCSNHFPMGKRTPNKPTMYYPSVFMTLPEYQHSITPKKRRLRETSTTSKRPHPETDMGESPAETDLLTVVENPM